MKRIVFVVAAAVAMLALPGAASAAGWSVTSVSTLVDRPDSGNNGYWAKDNLTRTVHLYRDGDLFACPDATPAATITATTKADDPGVCGKYYGFIEDSGSFATIPGAKSPNEGKPITPVTGKVVGGAATTEFIAHYKGDWANGQTFVGKDAGATTTDWVAKYFDIVDPTQYGLPKWSWTYTTACEKWVDAYDNGDGAKPGDGDITGKTCPTPTPTPTATPTPAPTPSATPTPVEGQPGLPNTGHI